MLLRIFIILIVLTVGPTVFLTWRFGKVLDTAWKKVAAFLPTILLPAIGIWFVTNRVYTPEEYHAVGLVTIIALTWTAIVVVLATGCIAGLVLRRIPHIEKLLIGLSIAACILLAGISSYGYIRGIYHLQTTHDELTIDDLPPSFEGYRLLFFSDFHLGTYAGKTAFPHQVIDEIIKQNADIILFGGDLINYDTKEIDNYITELKRLKAPDGVYAIMGNHDYQVHRKWDSKTAQTRSDTKLEEILQSANWHLLLNESAIIKREQDSIAIVGVENDGKPPFPELGDLRKALQNVPDSLRERPFMKILLTHDPTHWRRKVLPETDIQLTLSGHTHACQLQIGSYSPAAGIYKEWGGLYEEQGRRLFVSKGIGQALLNMRIGAWPEINVITLHCKK